MAIRENSIKKVFKAQKPKIKTSITEIEHNKIATRGYSQEDLIEGIGFSEMVYLLLKGGLPNKREAKMFNSILVSFCDHGITPPSTQTSRLIGSSGSPLNVALSGGLLSFGKNHAGAIEESMKLFKDSINECFNEDEIINFNDFNKFNTHDENSNDKLKQINTNIDENVDKSANKLTNKSTNKNINRNINKNINKLANDILDTYLNNNKKIPGFGHRYHSKDPRGSKILELAKKEGFIGGYSSLALAIEKLLFEKKGIAINVDGANGAVLLDMGFSSEEGFGIFMIGRIPGLIAHTQEEIADTEEFRKFCDIEDVLYCGKENRVLNK